MADFINLDAAYDQGTLTDWYISSVGSEPPVWTDEHIEELLNDFYVIPKHTPKADVEPVVHGHWIKTNLMFASSPTGRHGNVHICSKCGEQSGVGFKTPFCAICGAKMDEEG